ncbi:MAG: hypothetical protein N2691_02230 [Patescibacteria group bacterium]|nr:hypothetical protein [Patescibacteria group bacterium]
MPRKKLEELRSGWVPDLTGSGAVSAMQENGEILGAPYEVSFLWPVFRLGVNHPNATHAWGELRVVLGEEMSEGEQPITVEIWKLGPDGQPIEPLGRVTFYWEWYVGRDRNASLSLIVGAPVNSEDFNVRILPSQDGRAIPGPLSTARVEIEGNDYVVPSPGPTIGLPPLPPPPPPTPTPGGGVEQSKTYLPFIGR